MRSAARRVFAEVHDLIDEAVRLGVFGAEVEVAHVLSRGERIAGARRHQRAGRGTAGALEQRDLVSRALEDAIFDRGEQPAELAKDIKR